MRIILTLLLACMFVGCGQKGPLYRPFSPDQTNVVNHYVAIKENS